MVHCYEVWTVNIMVVLEVERATSAGIEGNAFVKEMGLETGFQEDVTEYNWRQRNIL